ncbi:MAG: hypothetical protein FJZ95_06675, partial [Chloroflexi bacterium]|nr:hypothetical protein [Chloroflexota bacterium]
MTVKRKVLVLIFAVILVAAGASTFISRSISINAVEDEIGNLLTTIAQSKSLQIQSSLSEKRDSVKSLSNVIATAISDAAYQNETHGRLDSPFVTYVLQRFKESDDSIHDILVWDGQGALVASTRSDGISESTESLTEAFSNGRTEAYIGEVVKDKATGDFVLCTSAPILIGGHTIGVVGLLNGVEDLFQIATDRTGLGETGEAYIVDAQGVLITPSRFIGNAVLSSRLDMSDLEIEPVQEVSDTTGYAHKAGRAENYLGGDVFRAYAQVPDMGWVVVAEKGSSEAFEPVARMTNTMLMVLLALLGVGAIGAFFVTRTITKPIMNLH